MDATNADEGTVMVVDATSIAHEQKVKVGVHSGDKLEITSGLKGDETVVTEGIMPCLTARRSKSAKIRTPGLRQSKRRRAVKIAGLVSNQSRRRCGRNRASMCGRPIGCLRLPIAIFPQTDFPRIVIIIDNGVVPAPQTLVAVTRPVEEAMNGIPGITRIRSNTSRGAAEIDLFFDWKTNILQSLQLVQARLSQLSSTLPPSASIRRVDRLTFAVFRSPDLV